MNQLELAELQRLEQRLLWSPQNDLFFKEDGDLIIDDAFLETKITRQL
jgi:hypothetical protein